jgi:hypothetical protein
MSTPKEDKLAKLKFEDITMGMNVSQTKVRISLEGEEGCPGIQVDKAWLLRLRDRMTELAGKLVDEEAAPAPESILAEAERVTSGDRQAQYGPPDQDFQRIAGMWTALKGVPFTAREVAMFMVCVKLSREAHQRKRDNWVDIAGYAKCGSLCGEGAA